MNSYKIIYSENYHPYTKDAHIKNLEEKVTKLLAEGYTCIGGVVISFNGDGTLVTMYQTMVKNV